MKIVINRCFGGFSISRKAFLMLRKMGNPHALGGSDYGEMFSDGSGLLLESTLDRGVGTFGREIPRDDAQLIEVVTQLGDEANDAFAKLKVVTIPDGVAWEIEDYDGMENVSEKHRTWE